MNELNPEDVMRAWEWNEHCAKMMGSFTASYTEINAILALLREKDAEIERLENICQSYALQYGTARDKEYFLKKAKAEAITEFAEKATQEIYHGKKICSTAEADAREYCVHLINKVAKELKGENE